MAPFNNKKNEPKVHLHLKFMEQVMRIELT